MTVSVWFTDWFFYLQNLDGKRQQDNKWYLEAAPPEHYIMKKFVCVWLYSTNSASGLVKVFQNLDERKNRQQIVLEAARLGGAV